MNEDVKRAAEVESLKSAVEVVFLMALFGTKKLATTAPSGEYDLREMLILYFLELYQARDINQKSIAVLFHLSPSSVCDTIERFLKKEWVSYAPDGKERKRPILVTDVGRKFLQGYFSKLAFSVHSMTAGTSSKDLTACGSALGNLRPAILRNLEWDAFGSFPEE